MKFFWSLIFCVVMVLMCGCDHHKTTESAPMTEDAKVVDLIFMPANHGRTEDQLRITRKGNLRYKSGESFTIPEHYAVVFECEHGKFVVEHDQTKAKQLWQRLKKDQAVTVSYKEMYREYWVNDAMVEKTLVDFDFLDAFPAR